VDELAYYVTHFDAVEVNSTFYSPPRPETAQKWVEKTPRDFLFSIKVWQKFTHPKMFEQATGEKARLSREDYKLFKSGVDPLLKSGKLACLLFQFPPSFQNTEGNLELLERIFCEFEGFEKVVELRHFSWGNNPGRLRSVMSERKASLAIIDEPKFASSIRQEFQPTGEIFYFRLHGRNAAKWWDHANMEERYDYLYTTKEVAFFAEKLKEISRNPMIRRIFVFFNNHPRANAPANAGMLQLALGFPLRGEFSEEFLSRFAALRPHRKVSS
jgi:uncharacterized protein YecE (DUF72 family)